MNIWIVKTGEPIPLDGKDVRLFRAGTIAGQLSSEGHNVIWWNANFYHQARTQRRISNQVIEISKNYKIVLLKSCGYHKSISFKRLLDHKQLELNFRELSHNYPKPDIIFCAFPTIGLASTLVNFGKANNVPVVIDVRDLWPDIFLERLFPNLPKLLGKLLIYPFNRKVNKLLNDCHSVTAVSQPMLSWAEKRIKSKKDNRVFPFGYYQKTLSQEELYHSKAMLNALGVHKTKSKLRVCLFATFNNSFDIVTVIKAAKNFTIDEIEFVFCGDGERLEEYKMLSKDVDNIFFTGWVGQNELQYLLNNSQVGLAPYVDSIGFRHNLTNKPLEYMSNGLVIVTCINGYLRDIIERNDCGEYYEEGNVNSLIKVFTQLLNNPGKLSLMSNNSKKLFNKHFEANSIYTQMSNYFKNIISEY